MKARQNRGKGRHSVLKSVQLADEDEDEDKIGLNEDANDLVVIPKDDDVTGDEAPPVLSASTSSKRKIGGSDNDDDIDDKDATLARKARKTATTARVTSSTTTVAATTTTNTTSPSTNNNNAQTSSQSPGIAPTLPTGATTSTSSAVSVTPPAPAKKDDTPEGITFNKVDDVYVSYTCSKCKKTGVLSKGSRSNGYRHAQTFDRMCDERKREYMKSKGAETDGSQSKIVFTDGHIGLDEAVRAVRTCSYLG
jgi:hypothetical protein